MVDSGIKVEKQAVEKMAEMKETKKSPYEFLILDIVQIPGATAVGTKSAPEHVTVTTTSNKGDSEASLEGKDLGGVPAPYYAFREMLLNTLGDKCCMGLIYFTFKKGDQGLQEKLLAVNWVPDSAPMKLKMRYSSTFKTMIQKAPKVNGKLEAHDADDLDYKNIIKDIF